MNRSDALTMAGYRFVVLDFLAGAAVFAVAARIVMTRAVSPPPTTSGRSPAGSASR
ncbi:MAG: hypothetical protein QOJ23_5198 [Actinomycetota bacterium]|nr:hypothetical protein [Actinomycetota bacterium]